MREADKAAARNCRPAPWRFAALFAALGMTAALTPRGLSFLPLAAWLWLALTPPRPAAWRHFRLPGMRPGEPLFVLCLLMLCALLSSAWASRPVAVLEKTLLVGLLLASAQLLLQHGRRLEPAAFHPGARIARLFLVCGGAGFALLLLESVSSGLLYENIWLRLFASDAPKERGDSMFNIGFMAYALLAFPMAMLLRSRLASGLLLAVMLAGVLLFSSNQSAMAGMLLGAAIVLLLPRLPMPMQGALPWLLLAAVTLLPFLVALLPPPRLFHRLDDAFASLYLVPRFQVYGAALDDILARPWLGYGFHASRIDGAFAYAHPHNYALQAWLELGIAGLLLFVWLLASLLRAIQALERRWRFHAMAAFFCALCGGAFSYNAWRGWWLGMLCMLVWLFVLFAREGRARKHPSPPHP